MYEKHKLFKYEIYKAFLLNKKIFFKRKKSSNFIKLGLIDTGTYGKVFKIKKINTNSLYACKEIRIESKKKKLLFNNFREINLTLSVIHPNLIFTRGTVINKTVDEMIIILEYCEYDLKSIIESKLKFNLLQIKLMLRQLLRALCILHDNNIIHRDLKTSNILLNQKGILKICDFGMARVFCPLNKNMTQGVITLWYRPPEILLGKSKYTKAVDLWSIGCIFAELIFSEVLLPGKSELDQLSKIFFLMGTPTIDIWINLHSLPTVQKIIFPIHLYSNLSKKFNFSKKSRLLDLLQRFFTYDPIKRIHVHWALNHTFFLKK
jgi:cell division cycle 2-like protein